MSIKHLSFMLGTFKILSSSKSEIYNKLLVTIVTLLCYIMLELIPPILTVFLHPLTYGSLSPLCSLDPELLFSFHRWMRSRSIALSCLTSNIMFSRLIHVAASGGISVFSVAGWYSIVNMHRIFFIHSSASGHLGWFHVLPILNSSATFHEIADVSAIHSEFLYFFGTRVC